MFCDYLKITGFNSEPILLSHQENYNIKKLFKNISQHVLSMNLQLQIKHYISFGSLTTIMIRTLLQKNKKIDNLYIADGHHRTASSALYYHKEKIQKIVTIS